ncbi:MAG: 4Fe-4S binding protein [Desulfotignum sp.]|nr:4Fe-4S binding protein [Desulfotignum sp.]
MTGKKSLLVSFLSVRRWFQLIFLGIVLAMGIQFTWFVIHLEQGVVPDFNRPPGVEAFLPISALVSLKHTISTWTINDIHPSGLVIFLIVCATALVVKKGFCSWVCPFGLFSDILAKVHTRLFHRILTLPKWIDNLFRSLKYLLAGFFIYYIFYKMPRPAIEQFINSPYNRFADIQMLTFFTDISPLALKVMLGLIGLSFVIPYFWCRYLCPYGAVLSVLGFLSIGSVQRDPDLCTRCGACEKHCPGRIQIRQKQKIRSPECSACLSCVTVCPEKNALRFSLPAVRPPFRHALPGIVIALFFTVGIAAARVSGNWQNSIPKEAYLAHVTRPPSVQTGGHPEIDVEKMKKMIQALKTRRAQTASLIEMKGE